MELEGVNRTLQRLASHDGLLGIANRREFERVLTFEWQRGAREQHPLSLLLIDVDYFKRFNDTYGHLAGDACLQQVAAVLRDALNRPADLVARYGGEEMAVLLPNTSLAGAHHVADRAMKLLAQQHIPFDASPISTHVTVSIGIASQLPAISEPAATLISNADKALYDAKNKGRNRVECYAAQDRPSESKPA